MMKVFDYIICGAGISGSYLAHSLIKDSVKTNQHILLLDTRSITEIQESRKNISFWTKDTFPFLSYAEKKWNCISFYDEDISISQSLNNYRYYSFTEGTLQKHFWHTIHKNKTISFKQEHIESIGEPNGLGFVRTEKNTYYGKYIFDSVTIPSGQEIKAQVKGKSWRVRFPVPVFDADTVTFMDFRSLPQNELMFFYLLPLSNKSAIVELAHFVNSQNKQYQYDQILHHYLYSVFPDRKYLYEENMGTKSNYSLFIPKKRNRGHVVRIGRAAGLVKPATGFGAVKIFKDTHRLVRAVTHDLPIPEIYSEIPYRLADMCMLHMASKKGIDPTFFLKLFQRYTAETLLSFLNEESTSRELSQLIRVPISLYWHTIGGFLRPVNRFFSLFRKICVAAGKMMIAVK